MNAPPKNLPPKNVQGNDLLHMMLNNIVLLYPQQLDVLKCYLDEQHIEVNEANAWFYFSCLDNIKLPVKRGQQKFFESSMLRESPRPSSSQPAITLPNRFVFYGPHIKITYEGAHSRPNGMNISGRLIFTFFDALFQYQATEKAWFIFTVDEATHDVLPPRVGTTDGFRVFEKNVLEDYIKLHAFVQMMICEKNIANLLKLLTQYADACFAVHDERPKSLKRLKALFTTTGPDICLS